MAKNSSKRNEHGAGVFVLTFLGSLAYLYVAYSLVTAFSASALFSGAGAVLLPIFAGVAIISAIALFLTSFTLINGNGEAGMTSKLALWAGISMIALTIGVGNGTLVGAAILGFVLAEIGALVARM